MVIFCKCFDIQKFLRVKINFCLHLLHDLLILRHLSPKLSPFLSLVLDLLLQVLHFHNLVLCLLRNHLKMLLLLHFCRLKHLCSCWLFSCFLVPSLHRIILLQIILVQVFVPKALEPLQKLQIILILCLHKFLNINNFLYPDIIEALLQDFIVLNELMFKCSFEVDFLQVNASREESLEQLAMRCT